MRKTASFSEISYHFFILFLDFVSWDFLRFQHFISRFKQAELESDGFQAGEEERREGGRERGREEEREGGREEERKKERERSREVGKGWSGLLNERFPGRGTKKRSIIT